MERKVIPASPTTLIALLRAVAYGWQQEAMEENARKISDLGRSLYDSLRSLGGHFDDLGSRLKSSLEAYNRAVGSLEGNVLVKARKFKELQAANGGEDVPTLEVDRPRAAHAAVARIDRWVTICDDRSRKKKTEVGPTFGRGVAHRRCQPSIEPIS